MYGWHSNNVHWVTCPRCGGTGKAAGGDCSDCKIGDVPVGKIRVDNNE